MNPSDTGLRVGFVPGVTLTKWRTRWAERIRAPLEVVEVAADETRRVLDEGLVDLCFVRLPIDRGGVHVIPLYDETMVAWVSKEHPIGAFDEITMADLAEETVLDEVDGVAFDRVNAGAVLLVPMSVARSAGRRDLVHRPVTDAEVSPVGLAWLIDNEHRLIDEFIGIVRGRTTNSARTVRERAAAEPPKQGPRAANRGRKPSGRRGRRP